MDDKRKIAAGECGAHGVTFPCEEIRGQQRFRVKDESGCVAGLIISSEGGWQNSHTSIYPHEVAVVHRGWVAIVTPEDDGIKVQILRQGDSLVMPPDFPHNTYMSAGSKMLYLKFGDCREDDWIADPVLDRITKVLTERDVLRLADR